MVELANRQEDKVVILMAKEFLEERLGMTAQPEHVQAFAQHISQFIQMYSEDFN